MAFTTVTLNTQPLLETTFVSDMRLILNGNVAIIKAKVEDLFNTFEIDLTNKYIGVDNFFNQVKTNNVILGNGITFMDSTNTIASLTKSAGKSIFSVDKIVIQAGGSIDMTGTGNAMAVTKFGVGMTLADLQNVTIFPTNGFYVGSPTTSVKSQFYGETSFPAQAVTQSTEGSVHTTITTTPITVSGTDYYYGVLKVSKSSKQFIYVSIKAGDSSPSASKPIILFLYEDSANRPDPGQSFTIVVKDYLNQAGLADVALSSWGNIYIVPGYTLTANGTPAIINDGSLVAQTSQANAITALFVTSPGVQCIEAYNSNIQANLTHYRKYGASVNFTKFETITSGPSVTSSRYVITASHNINIVN
jgi:hypothetical protein